MLVVLDVGAVGYIKFGSGTRNTRLIGCGGVKGPGKVRETIGLANGVRIALDPQCQRQLQVARRLPFILAVHSDAPQGYRHIARLIEALAVLICQAIRKRL